ncbi:immunoglobulin-like domain-containing protein, partial [Thiomicrorhabdus sp. 6S3-12]|uniref:immunoglobulin-like domain-containing protein n=1 Tax=Thiomicrorhabdus sp. 6S3-12 TaxID=2819681 RepID=UPI001AAD9D94
ILANQFSGSTSVTIDESEFEDVYVDSDSIDVNVSGTTGGNYENVDYSGASASTLIVDSIDTTTVSISGPASVVEGEAAVYHLSVDNPPETDMTVTVVSSHIDTDSGDLVTESQNFVIKAGDTYPTDGNGDEVTFSVQTLDDPNSENPEDFMVSISDAFGGNFENVSIGSPVTTTILDDSDNPSVTAEAVSVDEDDIGTIGNPGGVGDIIPDTTGSLAFVLGNDTLGSVALSTTYASELNATGIMTLDGARVLTTWDEVSHTLIGYKEGASPGDEGYLVFTIELYNIDNSGADYEVSLYQAVRHHDVNLADDTEELNLLVPIDVLVEDSDGSPATTSFDLTINDDTPIDFMPEISVVSPGETVADVSLNFSAGADRAAVNGYNLDISNYSDGGQVTTADGQLLYFGNDFDPVMWNQVSATEVQGIADGSVVFTLSIDSSDGTYDFYAVDGLFVVQDDDVPFENNQDVSGGNADYFGLTNLGSTDTDPIGSGVDVIVSASSTVNTDSHEFGAGSGQSLNSGEWLQFDFYENSGLNGSSNTVIDDLGVTVASPADLTESVINNFAFIIPGGPSIASDLNGATFTVEAYDLDGNLVDVDVRIEDTLGNVSIDTDGAGILVAADYIYTVIGEDNYAYVRVIADTGVGNVTGKNFGIVVDGFSALYPSDVALGFDATGTDQDGDSASGTILVGIDQVNEDNDDTMFEDIGESVIVEEGTVLTGNLLDNVIDNDSDQTHEVSDFTVEGTTYDAGDTAVMSGYGTVTVESDGNYSFTPEAGYVGDVPEISYSVVDVNDASPQDTDTSILSIEVISSADAAMMAMDESFDFEALAGAEAMMVPQASVRVESVSMEDLVQAEGEGDVSVSAEVPVEETPDEAGQDLLAEESGGSTPEATPDGVTGENAPEGVVVESPVPDETLKEIIESELEDDLTNK